MMETRRGRLRTRTVIDGDFLYTVFFTRYDLCVYSALNWLARRTSSVACDEN